MGGATCEVLKTYAGEGVTVAGELVAKLTFEAFKPPYAWLTSFTQQTAKRFFSTIRCVCLFAGHTFRFVSLVRVCGSLRFVSIRFVAVSRFVSRLSCSLFFCSLQLSILKPICLEGGPGEGMAGAGPSICHGQEYMYIYIPMYI